MTGNSSAAEQGDFDEQLLACVDDFNKLVGQLSRRYDMTVVIGALC